MRYYAFFNYNYETMSDTIGIKSIIIIIHVMSQSKKAHKQQLLSTAAETNFLKKTTKPKRITAKPMLKQ